MYGRLPTKEELAAADGKTSVQGPLADRIRAALDKPFSMPAGDDARIVHVLMALDAAFRDAASGLTINFSRLKKEDTSQPVPSLDRFDKMSIGAALEWIEDTVPDCRVAVRDYGLVIAPEDDVPPGAPLLHKFWKGAKAEDKSKNDQAPNPPPH